MYGRKKKEKKIHARERDEETRKTRRTNRGCVKAAPREDDFLRASWPLAVVLGGVLSPFRGSLRATGVKPSPPWDTEGDRRGRAVRRRAKSKNEPRRMKHLADEERDEEEEEEGDERTKRMPAAVGIGSREGIGLARNGVVEKMRSLGDSPQSQPGHVDLPIPRWA